MKQKKSSVYNRKFNEATAQLQALAQENSESVDEKINPVDVTKIKSDKAVQEEKKDKRTIYLTPLSGEKLDQLVFELKMEVKDKGINQHAILTTLINHADKEQLKYLLTAKKR